MRKNILFVIIAVSILMMSTYVIAVKTESPTGLSKEKNIKAPGHWKKNTEFQSQKHFVNEIHSRILSRLDQQELFPSGLIEQVNEFMLEIEEEEIEELLQPVAIITWTTPVYYNKLIYFYADASYDPDGGDLTLIEWDINGDGIFEDVVNNVNPISYLYRSTGTFYIGLRVTDDEGQIDSVLETVTVIN